MIDIIKYIGLPYCHDGDNPVDGFNCYTFAKYFRLKEFGLDTPTLIEGDNKDYIEVIHPVNSDIALISRNRVNYDHIGVVVNEGIIHCQGCRNTGHVIWHPLITARNMLKYKIKFFRG